MSWKKSVFSNLMWDAYTIITVVALVELSGVAVRALGGRFPMGLVLALVLAALVTGCVFLLRRLPVRRGRLKQNGTIKRLLGEAVFMVLLLALGFVIRVNGIAGAAGGEAYYEAALVEAGQSIPQMVHGADFIYLQLLHIVFLFLGNKIAVGVWLQVVLQMLAVVLLYFGVRKLAGTLPAMVMLGFFMCTGPVVQRALTLSPEPLFLVLFAVGMDILAVCRGNIQRLFLFLAAGIWVGFTGYLDMVAFLLLVIGVAVALETEKQEISVNVRAKALGGLLAGTVVGFCVSVFADKLFSGASFIHVLSAWSGLYAQEHISFAAGALNHGLSWQGPLVLLMFFGVISYCFDREKEYISIWIFVFCLTVGIQYSGLLTEQLPSFLFMLLPLTVLAGLGIRTSFQEEAVSVAEVPVVSSEPVTEAIQPVTESTQPQFLENPLPLPKPHQKKILDYDVDVSEEESDFDYPVDENDDFDIQ